MTLRRFADWDFEFIGLIEPERGPGGELREHMPQQRYRHAATTPLNAAGAGPFCRFKIGRDRDQPGLYVLLLDDNPAYAGECANLAVRWGLTQYGSISPKNCFKGGQSTNCRVNAAILAASQKRQQIELWFSHLEVDTAQRRAAETTLIRALRPPWNRAKLAMAKNDHPSR